MKTTINLLAALVIAAVTFAGDVKLHAAAIVKVTYTQNGDEVAKMVYTGPGGGPESDPAGYWKLLSKAPESAYRVKIKPDQANDKKATLDGDIRVSIEIRNQFNMGIAKTEKLTLIRDNADSSRWYLSASELKRVTSLVVSATEMANADTAGSQGKPKTAENSIYVKVFLPMKPLDNDKHPVESWVLDHLKKEKVEHARAVTDWVKLPAHREDDEHGVEVWDATTDGIGWGCPVHGTLGKLRLDGKVKAELNGWFPFPPTITGNTIPAETGNRCIAVVKGATRPAFFAILVGPPMP